MSKEENHISKNFLSPSDWERLLDPSITQSERKKLEKMLEDDPFAKEAYEGFQEDGGGFHKAVAKSEEARKRVAAKLGLVHKNQGLSKSLRILTGIAATLLLLGLSVLLINNLQDTQSSPLAQSPTDKGLTYEERTERAEAKREEEQPLLASDSLLVGNGQEGADAEVGLPAETDAMEEREAMDISTQADRIEYTVKEEPEPMGFADNLEDVAEEQEDVVIAEESMPPYPSENDATMSKAASRSPSASANAPQPAARQEEVASTPSSFQQGVAQYQSGDYKSAINSFQNEIKEGSNTAQSNYYIGLCYKRLKKYKKAVSHLDKVIGSGGGQANTARWERADIFITEGLYAAAKQDLQYLIDNETSFKAKAQEALDKLP